VIGAQQVGSQERSSRLSYLDHREKKKMTGGTSARTSQDTLKRGYSRLAAATKYFYKGVASFEAYLGIPTRPYDQRYLVINICIKSIVVYTTKLHYTLKDRQKSTL
jgi:hypothetical protein